jgi:hypothetical protein
MLRGQIYMPTRSCPSLSAQVMHLVAVSVAWKGQSSDTPTTFTPHSVEAARLPVLSTGTACTATS